MPRGNEFDNFSALVSRVMSVPKSEIIRREKEHKERTAKNLNRRGPKRKAKPSASPDPAAS